MRPADKDEWDRAETELKWLNGEKLKAPWDNSPLYPKILTAEKAAEALIAYTKSKDEPFHPDYDSRNNPWLGKPAGGGGGCDIL
jgi:hypothetical protein